MPGDLIHWLAALQGNSQSAPGGLEPGATKPGLAGESMGVDLTASGRGSSYSLALRKSWLTRWRQPGKTSVVSFK